MGDITPKRKPDPDRDPSSSNPDSALGEAPGSEITMPEIPGWNAETPEVAPPPKGYFPPVDLIEAWRQAAAQANDAPAAPIAEPDEHEAESHHVAAPVSNRLLVILTALGILVVAGLGGGYYLFFRSEPSPRPVVVPTKTPTVSPTPRPTRSPSPRPTVKPTTPPPAPSQPAPKTYTVQPGDTLITIGEKLGVDWRRIAEANGQIQDPNFITPGQVLKIP